jgi:hypothetical protein
MKTYSYEMSVILKHYVWTIAKYFLWPVIVLVLIKLILKIDIWLILLSTWPLVAAWITIAFIIPLTILFINHHLHSRTVVATIDDVQRVITVTQHGRTSNYRFEDVDLITQYLSAPAYDDRIDPTFLGVFSYRKFSFKDGRNMYLSSMVMKRSEVLSPLLPQITKKRYFPIIVRKERVINPKITL